jgi:hypothetical protein
MDRITVTNAIAEKIKQFPKIVYLCNDRGESLWTIERIDPVERSATEENLTESEIQQTLREIFVDN